VLNSKVPAALTLSDVARSPKSTLGIGGVFLICEQLWNKAALTTGTRQTNLAKKNPLNTSYGSAPFQHNLVDDSSGICNEVVDSTSL